jgi:hypothetical protein
LPSFYTCFLYMLIYVASKYFHVFLIYYLSMSHMSNQMKLTVNWHSLFYVDIHLELFHLRNTQFQGTTLMTKSENLAVVNLMLMTHA